MKSKVSASKFPALFFDLKKKTTRFHHKVVALLASLLYEAGFSELNYDHITIDIPKSPIPLELGKKRYDIAFLFEDRVVYISIETRKITELKQTGWFYRG